VAVEEEALGGLLSLRGYSSWLRIKARLLARMERWGPEVRMELESLETGDWTESGVLLDSRVKLALQLLGDQVGLEALGSTER
jgi:hypothetical protein